MLTQAYSYPLIRFFIRIQCLFIFAITPFTYAYAADGTAFYPNSFDVQLNNMSTADLNVYSEGNEYNRFGLYRDLPFTTNIAANLGRDSQVHSIDVSVKVTSLNQVESSFQPAFSISPRKQGGVPVVGRMSWLHQRTDFNHRVLAGFAIEACQKNADSWVNAGNSLQGHFANDHTLPITLIYELKMVRFFTANYPNPISPENSGTYTRTVRTEKNIICHRNSVQAPRSPTNQFIVEEVTVNSSRVINTDDRCGYFEGNVSIKTNRPNQAFSYKVVNRHVSPWGDPVTDERYQNVVTDSNGMVSDTFWHDVNYRSRAYTGDVSGNLRIVVGTFESRQLPFTINCNRPQRQVNVDKVKKLGINPTLQMPTTQLPDIAPISRPDAPDARLQLKNTAPTLKLMTPKMGSQPTSPNVLPTLKSNSRTTLPTNNATIKSSTPNTGFKQIQPPENKAVLDPTLEKIQPYLIKPASKTTK